MDESVQDNRTQDLTWDNSSRGIVRGDRGGSKVVPELISSLLTVPATGTCQGVVVYLVVHFRVVATLSCYTFMPKSDDTTAHYAYSINSI